MLNIIKNIKTSVDKAGGTIKKDLPQAISNALDQTVRLKATLKEAADEFAKPINAVIDRSIKELLDPKSQGALGMDGKDILTAGGVGIGGAYLASRFGKGAIQKLFSGEGGLAGGVATGKALETAAGVTPVYIVNMPTALRLIWAYQNHVGAFQLPVAKEIGRRARQAYSVYQVWLELADLC